MGDDRPVTKGECRSLHAGLQATVTSQLNTQGQQIRQLAVEVRESNNDTRKDLKHITGKVNKIDTCMARMQGAENGRREATGEAQAKSGQMARWVGTVAKLVGLLITIIALSVSAALVVQASKDRHEQPDPETIKSAVADGIRQVLNEPRQKSEDHDG